MTHDITLDATLAHDIMSWTYVDPQLAKKDPPNLPDDAYVYTIGDLDGDGPWVYRRQVGCGDFDRWSPTQFDRDALDVVKQIQRVYHRHVVLTLHCTGLYTCIVDPVYSFPKELGEPAVGCAVQPTLRQAICGAAREWICMREENNP